jgi:hypothetical protein
LLTEIIDLTILILEEYDKVSDETTRCSMVDLVKIVSDTAPRVTLVIVGVADNRLGRSGAAGTATQHRRGRGRTMDELKIPTLTGVSFLPDAKETKLTWLFKYAQTPQLEKKFVDYWVQELGIKNVAFLARNDDWGRAASAAYQARKSWAARS